MSALPFKDLFNNSRAQKNTQVGIVLLSLVFVFGIVGLLQPYMAEKWIEHNNKKYAQTTIDEAVEMIDGAHQILVSLSENTYELCSDDEIAHLKEAYMKADNIKDFGRRHGGNFLHCSAYLGYLKKPIKGNGKYVETADDLTVKLPAKLVVSSDEPAIVFIRGDYNAVIDKDRLTKNVPIGMNFKVGIFEPSTKDYYVLVDSEHVAQQVMGDITVIVSDWHYCASKYGLCMRIDLDENISDELIRHLNLRLILSTLLCGLFLGLVLLFLYRRSKSLSSRFKRALKNKEIKIVYQPIICFRTKKFISAEALIRWPQEPTSIELLIELAEKKGFINSVTDYVICGIKNELEEFLVQHSDFRITINVSAVEFIDQSLFNSIAKNWPHRLLKNQLGVELTERSSAQLEIMGVAIEKLCTMGHTIYIDDFGTGYSGLSQVSNLKVDFVKLDKSFITRLRENPEKASLIPDILSIVKRLDLGLVLEGVEFESDLKYFDASVCEFSIQGWLFARPMAATQLVEFIDEKNK